MKVRSAGAHACAFGAGAAFFRECFCGPLSPSELAPTDANEALARSLRGLRPAGDPNGPFAVAISNQCM